MISIEEFKAQWQNGTVSRCIEEHLWWAVPQRDDFMRQRSFRHMALTSKTEVSQFQTTCTDRGMSLFRSQKERQSITFIIEENVRWFQISMKLKRWNAIESGYF